MVPLSDGPGIADIRAGLASAARGADASPLAQAFRAWVLGIADPMVELAKGAAMALGSPGARSAGHVAILGYASTDPRLAEVFSVPFRDGRRVARQSKLVQAASAADPLRPTAHPPSASRAGRAPPARPPGCRVARRAGRARRFGRGALGLQPFPYDRGGAHLRSAGPARPSRRCCRRQGSRSPNSASSRPTRIAVGPRGATRCASSPPWAALRTRR